MVMKRSAVYRTGDDCRSGPGGMRSRSGWPAWLCGLLALVLSVAAAFPATSGAASAPTVQPVVLPRDQGGHPGFGEEWWYTSGPLTGANHRQYFWFATIWSADGALVAKVNVVDLRADRIVLSHEYVNATLVTEGQT